MNDQKKEMELLINCPICESNEIKIKYKDLTDVTFKCADGKWNVYQCIECKTAFIKERWKQEYNFKAYGNYYTHEYVNSKIKINDLNEIKKIRRKIINGYLKYKFNYKDEEYIEFGKYIKYIKIISSKLDREFRYMPNNNLNTNKKLLDIGSGNGSFLLLANKCGWEVTGIEIDKNAVQTSRMNGVKTLEGDLTTHFDKLDKYDLITMNHVIEHLHDPLKVVKMCHQLLNDKGALWLETPNIESNCSKYFGINWRGLEVPRHLIIFNYESLINMLNKAGFYNIKILKSPNSINSMYEESIIIKNDLNINSYKNKIIKFVHKNYLKIKLIFNINRTEVITIIAYKGG
jgi:2-polyprenyl-3-methyl-5-hydroxy-6-metoxy-1,4-benzoquinol methylase